MGLQQQLDRIRTEFEKQATPEALALMHRVINDLRTSGFIEGVPQETEDAPPFVLEDSLGNEIGLGSLLERGPAILTFFRGNW